MRVRTPTIGAFVIASLALYLMVDAPPAGSAFPSSSGTSITSAPGSNGLIVAAGCDDGASCRAQHLWTVNTGSGARRQLTFGSDRDENPSFSPDGRRIVFNRCPVGGHCRIATVAVTGANETDLTREPRVGDDESPSFSPDGSRIVFTRTERNGRHLYVMDADGHDMTRLTSGRVQDRGAVYSPDGSIVFERYDTGVGFRIYEVAANAGPPVPLTSGPGDYSPSISPDGTRILFGRRAGAGSAIWIMDADGDREHALTVPRAADSDAHPAFSPDGTQIVFDRVHGRPPAGQPLMVMDATGRGERAITSMSEFFSNADWQSLYPSGSVIAERCSTPLAGTPRGPTCSPARRAQT
jgi:Tol biopolymer transport system component